MSDNNFDFNYFDEGADIADHQIEARSYPQLQLMNANSTLHKGNVIEAGGFSIKADIAPQSFGTAETIKHQGGRSSDMRSAKKFRAAVIGWSPRHFVVGFEQFDDLGELRFRQMVMSTWPRASDLPTPDATVTSRLCLYLVLGCDPSRTVYELGVKGYASDAAVRLTSQVMNLKRSAESLVSLEVGRPVRLLPFAFWVEIGVGEQRLVGKTDQSAINDPVLLTTEISRADLVSKEDYLTFIKARKELDDYLSTGVRGVPQMPAARNPQIAAPAAAVQIAAPAA